MSDPPPWERGQKEVQVPADASVVCRRRCHALDPKPCPAPARQQARGAAAAVSSGPSWHPPRPNCSRKNMMAGPRAPRPVDRFSAHGSCSVAVERQRAKGWEGERGGDGTEREDARWVDGRRLQSSPRCESSFWLDHGLGPKRRPSVKEKLIH